MTDEELIARLRSNIFGTGTTMLASDRIEQLVAEVSRIEELEAKLAKAVESLEKINVGEGWAAQIARTTLAELTGAKECE